MVKYHIKKIMEIKISELFDEPETLVIYLKENAVDCEDGNYLFNLGGHNSTLEHEVNIVENLIQHGLFSHEMEILISASFANKCEWILFFKE